VALWPRIQQLLAQRPDERAGFVQSVTDLQRLLGEA
jgi:hypothetical protein